MSDWSEQQQKVYRFIRENKLTPENMEKLVQLGMIPREELEDRAYYIGVCRNTQIAQWIESPGWPSKTELPNKNQKRGPCFYHMREKFNSIYVEQINHPANDNGFDLFIPLRKVHEQV